MNEFRVSKLYKRHVQVLNNYFFNKTKSSKPPTQSGLKTVTILMCFKKIILHDLLIYGCTRRQFTELILIYHYYLFIWLVGNFLIN